VIAMPQSAWDRAAAMAARNRGLITVEQAATCGLSPDALRRAHRRDRCRRLHRGVHWLVSAPTPDLVTELSAARIAARGGVIAGHSAARLWGLEGARSEHPELVLLPDDTREQRPGIRLSWRALAPEDITEHRGLAVTTPARTLLDLARRESIRPVLPLVDSALHQSLITSAVLPALAARARRGRLAFALADGRAESVFESEVRLDLTLAGLAPEALQFEVRNAAGRWLARVDLAWPSRRLLVELDGYATHGTPSALRADLVRQNALVAGGWTVLRFAWADRGHVTEAVRAALTAAA
jgi:very-short-patch-repair endonuclease